MRPSLHLVELVHDGLGTVDGERRDEHRAAALDRAVDGAHHVLVRHLGVLVVAIAVGGLAEHPARTARGVARLEELVGGAADVAGEQYVDALERHVDRGGAEHVGGTGPAGGEAVGELDVGVELHPAQLPDGPLRVRLGVQRAGILVLGVATLDGVLGGHLLEVGGIEHHDLGQLRRGLRAPDGPGEALVDQRGDVGRVVCVGVGEDHHLDGGRVDGELGPVELAQRLLALEHAGVDDDAPAAGLEQVLGSGDGARGTQELEGHVVCHAPTLPARGVVRAVSGQCATKRGRIRGEVAVFQRSPRILPLFVSASGTPRSSRPTATRPRASAPPAHHRRTARRTFGWPPGPTAPPPDR